MSDLSQYRGSQLPTATAATTAASVSPLSRAARTMSRMDAAVTLEARKDLNNARLAVHRAHLETFIQKAEADSRADVMQHVMFKVTEVHSIAVAMCAGNDGLAMSLGALEQAYTNGEVIRTIRRANS